MALALASCGPDRAAPSNAARTESAAPVVERTAEPARPSAPKGARRSRFTELSEQACRLIEENEEEGGYWWRSCPGVGGYRLDWSEGDLRQGLAVVSDARTERLEFAKHVTNGAFNTIGTTVEWRGEPGQPPDRLVVRINVADALDPQRPDISKLVVVRLDSRACIVAVVDPGPEQSARARAIADGGGADCV